MLTRIYFSLSRNASAFINRYALVIKKSNTIDIVIGMRTLYVVMDQYESSVHCPIAHMKVVPIEKS